MLSIVEIAGFQYKVKEGMKFKVPSIDSEVGSTVEFDKVLLREKDGNVEVGKPYVENAKVVAEVVSHGKYPKVIHYVYRRRKDMDKKRGHRQPYTEILIKEIK